MAQVVVEDRGTAARAWDRVRSSASAARRRLGGLGNGWTLDRALGLVAVLLLPAGVTAIMLGWAGAARTPFLFEQVPYLISGGLLGVGLLTAGGLLYLATWIARSAQQAGAREDALRDVMAEVRDELRLLSQQAAVGGSATVATPALAAASTAVAGASPSAQPRDDTAQASPFAAGDGGTVAGATFVATPSGTMYHRSDCAVVSSRDDLRHVGAADGLRPCALCDPAGETP